MEFNGALVAVIAAKVQEGGNKGWAKDEGGPRLAYASAPNQVLY